MKQLQSEDEKQIIILINDELGGIDDNRQLAELWVSLNERKLPAHWDSDTAKEVMMWIENKAGKSTCLFYWNRTHKLTPRGAKRFYKKKIAILNKLLQTSKSELK